MTRRWALPTAVGALLAATLLTGAPAHAAAAPDAWSSENGGSGNAALNAGETTLKPGNVTRLKLSWTRADAVNTHGAPTIVDGVGYEIVNATPSRFEAFSLADGTTRWSVDLPGKATYPRGVSVSGSVALMSFDGVGRPGGITAVGLSSHRVIWSARQPKPADAGADQTVSGQLVADGERAYLLSPFNTVSAFRFSDGGQVWKTTFTGAAPNGIAVASKSVFTGGAAGVVAYDAATGEKQWKAPGVGKPVAAGGRVITAKGTRVVAVAAGGCGQATCRALWDVTLPYKNATQTTVGGVDGVTGYLVYTNTVNKTGGLVRFGAVSGKILWKAEVAPGAIRPARGATTVWTVAANKVLGFSTTATATKPAVSVAVPADLQTAEQNLALAGGKVFVRAYSTQLGAFGLPAA